MPDTTDLCTAGSVTIERLTGIEACAVVEPLFREYVAWVMDTLAREHGVRLGDRQDVLERHHAALAVEMPRLLVGRGRLLLARIGGQPVGVGVLKPVDDGIAEVKRMYLQPSARGRGIARALLLRLVADARAEGFRTARLETLGFMIEALALYRALGFVDARTFEPCELGLSGLAALAHCMELRMLPAG